MNLEGTADFPYTPGEVWNALHDVDVLEKAVPGCNFIELRSEGLYFASVSLGVSAIKGDYEGTIQVTDLTYPNHYTVFGEGKGKPGYVKVNADCKLEATENGTHLIWSSEAEVGGVIAGIGGRVLTGISKFMAKKFFKALTVEMEKSFKPIEGVGQ